MYPKMQLSKANLYYAKDTDEIINNYNYFYKVKNHNTILYSYAVYI